MRKWYKFITSCLLLALILCGCTNANNTDSTSNTDSTNNTNILNAAQVYSIVKDYDYWRYSFDGTVTAAKENNIIQLQGEPMIADFKYENGYLYYVKCYNIYSAEFDIIRMNVETDEQIILLSSNQLKDESNSSFHSITISGNCIYVQMGFRFYQYNIIDDTVEELYGDVGKYTIFDNKIWFIDHVSKGER